jgi:hypothetical protein
LFLLLSQQIISQVFSLCRKKSRHPGNIETEETAAMLAVAGCSWLF